MAAMGLMKKIFGGATTGSASVSAASSQFHDSTGTIDQAKTRNAPRRELVQVILRDTMRKHGVPSDWVDCRILSVVTRQHKAGMHVQFLVRKGDEQLLNYVHAFQESFWDEILKFEPQAHEWLFSVAWQFYGKAVRGFAPMPGPGSWTDEPDSQSEAGDTQPHHDDAEDLASDLQALYAIRDAALEPPARAGDPAPKHQRSPGKP